MIPKYLLMRQLARKIVDGPIISVAKQWLNAGKLHDGINVA